MIYKIDVDLTSGETRFDSVLYGWSPNEQNDAASENSISDMTVGDLELSYLNYITTATDLVGGLTVYLTTQ